MAGQFDSTHSLTAVYMSYHAVFCIQDSLKIVTLSHFYHDTNPPRNSLSSSSMVMLASSGAIVIRGVMGETRLREAENDSVSSKASSLIIGTEMLA